MICYENVVIIALLFIQHNDHKTNHKNKIHTPVPDENYKETMHKKGPVEKIRNKVHFWVDSTTRIL